MKIVEKTYTDFITDKLDPKGYRIVKKSRKINMDGQEILKWMRGMAKIKSMGLYELPKFKGSYLGRFVDTSTLTSNGFVILYTVREQSLLRIFIDPTDNPKFTNSGSATEISALSEISLMKNIISYRDKHIIGGGLSSKQHIKNFIEQFKKLVKNGGSCPKSNVEIVMEYFTSYNYEDGKLTPEKVEKLCGEIINSHGLSQWKK